MRYYLAQRNEQSSHDETWRKCKHILISERSQFEKAIYYITPTTWHSGKGETMDTAKTSGVGGVKDE